MKKNLITILTYFFSIGIAFGAASGDVKQSQHVSGILIPRIILNDVITNDDKISGTPGAVDKMLAKYDSLAGPLGQTKLTSEDIAQICLASGVITEKPECKERVLNPILSKMGKVRFMNVCDGKKSSGGTNYCIDDVFIATKKQNANQYHQDVNISPYTAYGFAIEYAKKQGHDVWCSSEIKDNIVNCTTLDNKHFYSVKFNGTNNTNDSTIEKNLVKGICALFDSKYAIGTFRHQCKLNCGSGTEARKVIQKFGLNVHDGYTTENHCEIYQPTYSANEIKKYPGYEYMSNTFKSVQTVLDSQLIDVLKEYVKLQGIDVQSFECDYSPKKYSEQMSNGMPTSFDDMLSCKINGIDTDFIFDDLFESKEYERRAGAAALQCILSNGQYGTDRMCRGLTRAQCDEANNKVPGGTRWDEAAELCVLNRADSARKIGNTIQITGGVVLTAGITFATGGGAMIALVAGAGSVAFDAAFIGLERLQILEPASRARAFAEQAQKCEIPIDSKYPSCSTEQVNCAWRAVNDNFARLDEILENLNPDQLSLVSDLMENVTDCLDKDSLSSAVQMSTPNAWDKALNKANAFLLVAGIFISPENTITKWATKAPKIATILRRCTVVDRVSDTLGGARYLRIYVDNLDSSDINRLVNEFKQKGLHVSSNMEKSGRQFIGVADNDIFAPWRGLKSNWLNYGSSLAELRTKASKSFDTYLAEVKTSITGTGAKLPKERLTDAEWETLNKSLAPENVQLVDTGNGYMQFRRADAFDDVANGAHRAGAGAYATNQPGKRGLDLAIELNNRGMRPYRVEPDGFYGVQYRSAEQCLTGLKFHISVHPDDLEKTSFIIDDIVRNNDTADIWKVYLNGMGGTQLGKDFTVYVSRNGYDARKIQNFLNNIEDTLRKNGVRSNGFGANVINGDRAVPGSNYINYRYDRTNNFGIPDGKYNNSYQFVAPRPEYGGDIMDGIWIR